MRKLLIAFLLSVALCCFSCDQQQQQDTLDEYLEMAERAGKQWQDYTNYSEDIADDDTFLARNISDTTDSATYGSVNEATWGRIREQIRTDRPVCFGKYAFDTDDDFLVVKNTTGETITIQNIYGVLLSGTNVVGGLDECDSDGANCSAVDSDITFNGGEDTDDGSLSNPSIDSGDWIRWHTTSISSPGYCTICFTFK